MPTKLLAAVIGNAGVLGVPPAGPSAIPDLHAWYRADDLVGADDTGVTGTDAWIDRSDNLFHMDVEAGAPVIRRGDGPNGTDAVSIAEANRFVNSDAGVAAPWVSPDPLAASVFVIAKPSATNNRFRLVVAREGGADNFMGYGHEAQRDPSVFAAGGHSRDGGSLSIDAGVWHKLGWVTSGVDGATEFFVNDTSQLDTGSLFNDAFAGRNQLRLSDEDNTSFTDPWAGDVAEVVIYSRTLTSEEITELFDYFNLRYSL